MKHFITLLAFLALFINVNAYDFSVKNADGITIYYSYINDGKEVMVTYEGHYKEWNSNRLEYVYYYGGYRSYSTKNIVIPESVTYNGRTYPVTKIGDYAFRDSHINSVILPNSIKEFGYGTFRNSWITEITIPASITEIPSFTFDYCIYLKNVSLPEGLNEIGDYAFDNCKSLTEISIPESVTILKCFTNCTGLKTITIPKNVTDINFSGCDNLLEIYSYIKEPRDISSYAFTKNTYYSGTLYVPKRTIEKYKSKEGWKSFTYIEEMPNSGEPDTYQLTYMVDGKEYKSYEIEIGSAITPETAPIKEGYTFSGWSEIPSTMPANDVIVTGMFSINKYKLTYILEGMEYKTYEIEYGASITPEQMPTKEGYTFSGWSTIPETMPAMDITVTGSFSQNSYKLTYLVDGKVYKTVNYDYEATITPEPVPTKEGYTFIGWSEIPEKMPAKDVMVTGNFTINKYKLVYQVDGKDYKTYDVEYGSTITAEKDPQKEGCTFSGWSWIPKKMPAEDVAITGTFTTSKYKLIYTIDGQEYKTYEIEYGEAIIPEETPTKNGYTFSGWSDIPENMPSWDVTIAGSFIQNTYGKCATPIIRYTNGKLTFESETEDAACVYTITDNDIKSETGNSVQLEVTYLINVYAMKSGYDNSDVATATLCWIDVEPKTEGITNIAANVRALPVIIQNNGSTLTVSGADDETPICVYSITGTKEGSAISQNGAVTIHTTLQSGSTAIVKVGNKNIKVVMK